jgi:hypothetical protein
VLRTGLDPGDRSAAFGIELTANNGQRPFLVRRAADDGNVTPQFPMAPPAADGGASDAEADAAEPDAAEGDAADAGPKLRPPFTQTWVKLVRVGNRFAGFTSANGRNFEFAFEVPAGFVIAGNAYAGLFVTSQTEGAPAEGTLESVTVQQPPVTPLPLLPDAAAPDGGAGDGAADGGTGG